MEFVLQILIIPAARSQGRLFYW